MSISIHSETSKDEIETEDAELEDLVWNLMSRTGLLSQIQGQISKFIEDNGKADKVSSLCVERADGRILGLIFEYLQWIGMKQTNSVLLSESPVEVDVSIFESRQEGPDYKPEICKLVEDHNLDEGKGSPSRSHNYSRDEFEDSRLTSASGHQSIKSDNFVEDEASQNDESEEEESYSSHKQTRRKSIQKEKENFAENTSNLIEQPEESLKIEMAVPNEKSETDIGVEDRSADMISFNSPLLPTRGFDQIRPNVTLRQRFDLNAMSDPFQSPTTSRTTLDSVPVPIVDSNNRLNFVQASNSLDEILNEDRKDEEAQQATSDDVAEDRQSSLTNIAEENAAQDKSVSLQESENESIKVGQNKEVKEPPSASQDEEESTSDLLDMLTMEEDTQDASIDSDTKGMSSCEHAVSLK